MEHLRDETSGYLLSVHTDGEGLHASQEKEGVERRKTVTDGIDHESDMFCEVVPIAYDDSSHKVMVARQVLGRTIINDVRAVFERALKVWTHHRVVDHYNRVWGPFLDLSANLGNVHDLEQWVSRGFEQNHGDLRSQVWEDRERLCCVNMVNGNAIIIAKVVEQTVGTAVEVIAGDYGRIRFYEAGDDIEGRHSRRNCERMGCGVDFRKVMFCRRKAINLVRLTLVPVEHMTGKVGLKLTQVRSRGVTAPCIIVLSRHTLKGSGLVDRNATGPVLVL